MPKLALTRRSKESIMIGDDIKVTFVGYSDGRARITVEAPREVPVHREEIYLKIKSDEQK